MKNGNELPLERCPHCSIAKPHLVNCQSYQWTEDSEHESKRYWSLYRCVSCGGVVLTVALVLKTRGGEHTTDIVRMWPQGDLLSDSIPERARSFLKQGTESLHAPSAAQILAASAVDAMLKAKGYKAGVLNSRIKQAATDGLITAEMAEWAHEVRLDANDQRHSDEDAPLPTKEKADKTIEFAKALAQFLFVLPAMVSRGRAKPTKAQVNVQVGTVTAVTTSEPA